jgi:hypothetical protein
MVEAAFAQVEASAHALEHASEADAKKAAAAAISGKKAAPVSTVSKRRAELEASEARLTAARSGLEQLEASGSESAAADKARTRIERAITELLRAELPVADMIKAYAAAQEALIAKRIMLRELVRSEVASKEQARQIEHMFCEELPPPHGHVESFTARWSEHRVATHWRKLREKLAKNPDTPVDIE